MRSFLTCVLLTVLVGLQFGCKTYHAASLEVETIRMDTTVTDFDQEMEAKISVYREQVAREMDVVLCKNEVEMVKGKPESTLTNWFADLSQKAALANYDLPVDFSVQNYGGIRRRAVGKGEITVGTIYELMPFDNQLIILELDSANVAHLVSRMARVGGWPVSKELRFKIISDTVATDIRVNGEALTDRTYYVNIPDYIANGGDGMDFLSDLKRHERGILIRTALIEMLEKGSTIEEIPLDGRITIEGKE